MASGDIDCTDLNNLFCDMKVISIVDNLARPFQWLTSGVSSAAQADRSLLKSLNRSIASDSELKSNHAVASFPSMLKNETSRL